MWLREMKLQENGESYIILSYMHFILRLNIIMVLKSRRLRWEGHAARIEQSRKSYRVLVGRPEEKRLSRGREMLRGR